MTSTQPSVVLATSPSKGRVTTGVVPVKAVIKRPRTILKIDHLMSRKGVAALPEVLKEAQYRGKGHELNDLRLLLAKSKHWAHRLFPTLTFEDFVEKAEVLGNKKLMKCFVARIRRGDELVYDLEPVKSDDEDEHEEMNVSLGPEESNKPNCELEFDRLFGQSSAGGSGPVTSSQMTTPTNNNNSTAPKPPASKPIEEEFIMDDDDYDEDFLASFKM